MVGQQAEALERLPLRKVVFPEETKRNFLYYFGSVLALFVGLLALTFYLLQPWRGSHVILGLVMYGLAMTVVDRVFQHYVRELEIPRLCCLMSKPRVAILYLTYNDAVEECLEGLGNQTYPCDVFILDDSTKPEFQQLVNRYKHVKLRRRTRKDNKAGAINEWLHYYGDKYDYFVTYDADSMLPPNAIRQLLLYAEAPLNKDVAVFQASMHLWNAETVLAKLLGRKQNVDNVVFGNTLSYTGSTLWFGHNALCRVRPFQGVGIRVDLLSEDFATSCELIRRKYRLLTVPVLTYEGIPNDMRSYLARAMRWFHGGHESIQLMSRKLPLAVNYRLWTVAYTHLQYTVLPVIMLIFVFNKPTRLEQFQLSTAVFVAFWLIPAFSYALYLHEMRGAGVGLAETMKTIFVATSVRVATALYEWKALLLWAVGRKPKFGVTPKNKLQQVDNRYLVTLGAFVAVQIGGIAFYNQEALLYGIFWLPPLVAAPVVLYRVNRLIRQQVRSLEKTALARRFEVVLPERKERLTKLDVVQLRRIAPAGEVSEPSDNMTMVSGDLTLPGSVEIMTNLSVRGAVRIGARSILHGDLRAQTNVEIGERSTIEGAVLAGGNCWVGRYTAISDIVQAQGDVELNEGCHVGLSAVAGGKVVIRGTARVVGRIESKRPVEIISETTTFTLTSSDQAVSSAPAGLPTHVLEIVKSRGYLVQTLTALGTPPSATREFHFLVSEPHADGKKTLIMVFGGEVSASVEKIAGLQAVAFSVGAEAVRVISATALDDDAKRLAQFYQMALVEKASKEQVEAALRGP